MSRKASIVLAVTAAILGIAASEARAQVSLQQLPALIRALRESEAQLITEREARFRAVLERQEQQARSMEQRRDAAEARGNALDRRWNENEARIAELSELLSQHQGNLGELFGVTRQVAGDAANVLEQSLLSAQYSVPEGTEERAEFMVRLAAARALPSIYELERLWFELQREMTDTAKVVRFEADILSAADPSAAPTRGEIVRVGPFTAVSNGEYLGYLPGRRLLSELGGRLPREFRATAGDLQAASADAGYVPAVVDPARGALLGLYVQRPNVIQRFQRGEVVGYVIVGVGVLGALLAIYQFVYLVITGLAVKAQLRHLDTPNESNPLGRVLTVARAASARAADVEVAELRISEAILRELPKLERFQSFLRLAVAAGPLLGLIGTVIGMIITFKAITATASADPSLMARGIGQAMIATVLGLGIAIPLLFINAGLVARSRAIIQVLDEQSQTLVAAFIGSRKAAA